MLYLWLPRLKATLSTIRGGGKEGMENVSSPGMRCGHRIVIGFAGMSIRPSDDSFDKKLKSKRTSQPECQTRQLGPAPSTIAR